MMPERKATWRRFWREHGLPLLFFALLGVALSWPTVRHFTTHLTGHRSEDPFLILWGHWHFKEALLGHTPLLATDLLYFPRGITLLNHAPGPITGLLALPFWPLGPEAAFNGAYLVGLTLTGFCMYLLARSLGLGRGVALFAGLVLVSAPMTLAGLYGHLDKTFLALFPLLLLALRHALDPQRSRRWAVATAAILTLTLFYHGYHFVGAVLALGFFVLARLLLAPAGERYPLLQRSALLALAVLLLTGPLVLITLQAAGNPVVQTSRNLQSSATQPDLVELVLPPAHSRLLGGMTERILGRFDTFQTIETAVGVSLAALALALLALWKKPRPAAPWVLFLLVCMVLALGPSLQVWGRRTFTEYNLPVMLPYAALTALPGMDGMRVSGRFMLVGNVALAMAAGYGLAWLVRRWPGRGRLIVLGAILLVLLPNWPAPWPRQPLPATPAFYEQIAGDEAQYGVFDLPVRRSDADAYILNVAHYQMQQMTHGKGIHGGYLSFPPLVHPLFPCLIPELRPPRPDVLVNGEPVTCYQNALFDLATFDYRYVVWHKQQAEAAEMEATTAFLLDLLDEQPPVVDDEQVQVYAVPPVAAAREGLAPTMALLYGWYGREGEMRRWTRSPAGVFLSMPQAQSVTLELTPEIIYEPGSEQVLGTQGTLHVALNGDPVATVTIRTGETTAIPLDLPAGVHTVTLALEAGNFRPGEYGGDDFRELSFAIQEINLEIGE